MNKKAKEDWEKKQADEAEKLRKLNEASAFMFMSSAENC